MELTFNTALDDAAGRKPPADAFTVRVDGAVVEVTGVTVSRSSRWVRLAVSPRIQVNHVVEVSYSDPDPDRDDDAAIQHPAGVDAESFTGRRVDNQSTVPDRSPPRLRRAWVDPGFSANIHLQFYENLNRARLPGREDFSVTIAGAPRDIESSITVPFEGLMAFSLNISGGVSRGQPVTVRYRAPAPPRSSFQDAEGIRP